MEILVVDIQELSALLDGGYQFSTSWAALYYKRQHALKRRQSK
jgi:hypothetical protein